MKPSFEDLKRRIAEAEKRRREGKPSPADVMDSLREAARHRRGCLSYAVVGAMLMFRPRGLANVRAWFHLLRCSQCRAEFLSLWPASADARCPSVRLAFAGAGAAALIVLAAVLLAPSPNGSDSPPSIARRSSNSVPPSPTQADGTGTAPMLLASRGTTNDSQRRIAIVIGYGEAVAQARNAAEKLDPACSMVRPLIPGGFPETRPTLANILRELAQLPASAEGGHLVVFWAGEGVCVNDQAYLIPQDSTGDAEAGLTLEQLSKAVADSKLNLQSRTLVVQVGTNAIPRQSFDFVRCLLANPGDWQIKTNAQAWLQSFNKSTK